MKNKSNVYLDFDNTLVDSIYAFAKVYSDRYKNHKDYTKPNLLKHYKWDFSETCPLLQKGEIEDIFESYSFFEYLTPMPHAKEVLNKLKNRCNLSIISIGTFKNIELKSKYIKEIFPMIDKAILIADKSCTMNKSIITNGILIDDHMGNLTSSKADIKICFGEVKEYNEKWTGFRGKNWLEIDELLFGKN